MTNIAWTSANISLCPDWYIKKSHGMTMGMFSCDFLHQSLTLLSLLFFHIPISPMQWLLSLPKADRKMGLQIYGRRLTAKASEIPIRKSDILTLTLLLNQSEKMRVSTWSKFRFYWTGVSNLSVKTQLQKEARGCKAGEKRNMNNWKQQLLGSQNNQQPLFKSKISHHV